MKKTLSLLLLSVLFLSGCSKQETQVVNADTLLDQQIFESAADSKDSTLCETIKDETKKDECSKVVEALLLKDQAIADKDVVPCNKIQIERYKTNCVQTIANLKAQIKNEEKMIEEEKVQLEKDNVLSRQARLKKDVSICNEILNANLKSACETEVTIDTANATKNIKACDFLKSQGQIEVCRTMFFTTD